MALVLDGSAGVSGVDGTASNPSYEGTDSNTGIFYPAADTVAIGTGGTERLRVDSAGNAGLAVTPSAWQSTIRALQVGTTASFYSLNTASIGNNFYTDSGGTSRYLTSSFATAYVQNSSGQHAWYNATSGTAGNTATFTQAMTLDASGYLLVGATSTDGVGTARLQVGSTNATSQIMAKSNTAWLSCYASSANDSYMSWNTSGFLALGQGPTNGSTFTERARITSGGVLCVGGTTARGSRLTLQCGEANSPTLGTASGGVLFGNSDSSYGTLFGTAGAGYGWIQQQRVDGSATAYDLYLQPSGGALYSIALYNNTVGATNRDVFVDNAGKVGYVASIRASKTNIQDLTDTSWLHQLNPVSFNYRKKDEEGNYTDETDGDIQYGMIAEDVEQVRPDLCFYDEVDGEQELRGIQYSKLVPVMLKEIQKLKAEIAALKGAA